MKGHFLRGVFTCDGSLCKSKISLYRQSGPLFIPLDLLSVLLS